MKSNIDKEIEEAYKRSLEERGSWGNKNTNMKDLYKVVQWPDIQELMDKPGFEDNSYLINDDKGLDDFGSSAYFINLRWLEEL